MKELSIEQKAKAYDEAIKIAQETYNTQPIYREWLEQMFPKLKESEDDKIKKWIRKELESKYVVDDIVNNVMADKALAWLEKQGEKQGEKAEPKFHEGDWVIDKRGIIDQIVAVIENVTNHTYGYDTINGEYFNDYTEGVRLWTIEDVKDGDVLKEDSCIFIIKRMNPNGTAIVHCCLFDDDDISLDSTLGFDVDSTYPATKEQRDLLFKKMKEAGYEWNAEKKELTKIENEHTSKHKIGDTIYYNSFGEVKSMIVANVITDSTDNPMYEDKEYNAVFEKDLIEQKPADNDGPKFKVGDWCIDNEDDTIFQIVKVLDNTYTYKTNEGKEYSCTHYSLENDAKVWTIQDAKDGDVLVDEDNNVGIYKEIEGIDWNSYIYLGCNRCLFSTGGCHVQNNTKPSTKEQRDLLFQKMHEAGYSFDFETKELKKDEINIKAGRNYRCTKTHIYAGLDWFEGTKYYADEDYSLVNNGCTCFCPKYSKYEHNNLFEEVEYDGCVEKQGKQKTYIEMKTPEESLGVDSDTYNKIVDECVYGDQKPVDKVEPKFNVGDWIVRNYDSSINIDYSICKITNVENGNYTIESIYGYKGYNAFEIFEKNYHIWTIQDAKDGDVLYSPEGKGVEAISIVRGWKKVDGIRTLCASLVFRVKDNEFIEGGIGAIWWEGVIDQFFPATKEQRDLLFQKMKEAGYEWDEENKKLKKSEHEPTWSKEDEEMLEDIRFNFTYNKEKMTDALITQYDRFFDKIKSLKPQPKQEWGEEDENYRLDVNSAIDDYFSEDYADELRAWLKSLKERYTYQPSDKQTHKNLQNQFIKTSEN